MSKPSDRRLVCQGTTPLFDTLTTRLQQVFKELARHGKLTQEDVDRATGELRLALLEADVHANVVDELLAKVGERALGEETSRSLNPSQQVAQILYEEIVQVLGTPEPLKLSGPKPRVILLAGLQGSGKTTTAAKLAYQLRQQGERVWMVAADIQRPAAVRQLETLGEELAVHVYKLPGVSVEALAPAAVEAGRKAGASVLIFDTAGRSQIDDSMMTELTTVERAVHPEEILLVADAMTGQEAVHIAEGFSGALHLTGLILTKMDGDARGGAAISMRHVTGVPVKYIGTGEARDELQPFDPPRLASRILGRGDMATLIEKAGAVVDPATARQQAERLASGTFTLDDFAEQLNQVRTLGPVGKLMEMLPAGIGSSMTAEQQAEADARLSHTTAIISSMTLAERRSPRILNARRKRRIAAGSGTTVQEVNQMLRQFEQMRKVFKKMGKRGTRDIASLLR